MLDQCAIPMSSPDISAAEIDAVNAVLHTPMLSMGPQIEAFEQAGAAYVGARHAIGVNSGTAGLHLGIIAADVQPGQLVVTTPFSFIASANSILYERGVPIFVDVDPQTGNIDPNLVRAVVADLDTGGPAAHKWLPPALRGRRSSILFGVYTTRAILPVHAFGQPADMDPILAVARQYGLRVIEDACEAIGAEYKGRKAGTFGDMSVFAFYPNKQMTTGEGGLIVTDDAEWATLFHSLRNQGRDVFDEWLCHSRLGYNYRLDEMSAALGVTQLGRLDELLAKRARVADWYNTLLAGEELIDVPHLAATTTRMSWFVYVVRIKPPARRDDVMHRLAEVDIASRPYFSPIHLQPLYRSRFGYQPGDFPIAEHLGDVSLALPFWGTMTADQVECVVASLETSRGRQCGCRGASVTIGGWRWPGCWIPRRAILHPTRAVVARWMPDATSYPAHCAGDAPGERAFGHDGWLDFKKQPLRELGVLPC